MGRREEALSRSFATTRGAEAAVVPMQPEKARGVDVEITERGASDTDLAVVPNRIKLNGQEVLVPSDESIRINGLENAGDPITVTVTMFVRSLVIRAE